MEPVSLIWTCKYEIYNQIITVINTFIIKTIIIIIIKISTLWYYFTDIFLFTYSKHPYSKQRNGFLYYWQFPSKMSTCRCHLWIKNKCHKNRFSEIRLLRTKLCIAFKSLNLARRIPARPERRERSNNKYISKAERKTDT